MSLLAGLAMQAQGFVFQYQGQNLADGETVIIAAEEDMFGDLSCETNNAMNPNDGLVMKLLGIASVNASATIQITHNTLDAGMLQWCMGGQCTPFNNKTSLTKTFKVEGSERVQFDAIGITGEGYLQANLKVTVGLESHQVNIIFANGDIDGIKSLSQSRSGKEVLFDLRGRQVQGKPTSGIYILADGVCSRKVVIK